MASISEFMTHDHRRCDGLFAELERAASEDDWARAAAARAAFAEAVERHFRREEAVLFPAFEARTGNAAGPTAVMRAEHAQLHELLAALAAAVDARDAERALGLCDTFQIMNQQHNMKEEQILYPASDRVLAAGRAELLARLQGPEAA